MTDPIISRDTIKAQARRAVDAGIPATENPYMPGTSYAKRWLAEYLTYDLEKYGEEPCKAA